MGKLHVRVGRKLVAEAAQHKHRRHGELMSIGHVDAAESPTCGALALAERSSAIAIELKLMMSTYSGPAYAWFECVGVDVRE